MTSLAEVIKKFRGTENRQAKSREVSPVSKHCERRWKQSN